MADKKNRVPVREQAPEVRAKNFEEVCLGYNKEEAMEEASRCLNCKNARCITGCPVNINIPAFIAEVKEGNFEKASQVIGESSALPAVCGRVCPQESQCEGKCILGIKGEPVSIGKLERFTADWARENNIAPIPAKEKKGKKVAVIGSGPAGLTCAGDLAKMGYDVKIFEALHEAGGVLVYGIPEFRLPKQTVVAHEVDNVKKLGVEIYAVSTDTHFTHKAWHESSAAVGKVQFPMLGDKTGQISRNFDVLIEKEGLAERGTFVINPAGKIVVMEHHDSGIGRDASELLRTVEAAQYVDAHPDQVCPAKWRPGKETLVPSFDLVGKI